MNKNQVFVFLFFPLLVLSGCIFDDANSEDSDGVVLEVEIESNDAGVPVSDGTSDPVSYTHLTLPTN